MLDTPSVNNDFKKLAEPFQAHEIEWRIGQCGKKRDGTIWAKVLAYVQSRAVMDRFDEVCGVQNWSVEYRRLDSTDKDIGGIICKISVNVASVWREYTWVSKEDGAEQTDIEAFKGGLSSAFKRAAVAWGVGRYLYHLEEGWAVICDQNTKGARYAQTKDKEAFYWLPPELPAWALPAETTHSDGEPGKAAAEPGVTPAAHPGKAELTALTALIKEKEWKVAELMELIKARFGADRVGSLTLEEYQAVYKEIKDDGTDPQSYKNFTDTLEQS